MLRGGAGCLQRALTCPLDAAGVHHDDPVGHPDSGQAVCDYQHRDQPCHVRYCLPQHGPVDRVKLGGCFIQQQVDRSHQVHQERDQGADAYRRRGYLGGTGGEHGEKGDLDRQLGGIADDRLPEVDAQARVPRTSGGGVQQRLLPFLRPRRLYRPESAEHALQRGTHRPDGFLRLPDRTTDPGTITASMSTMQPTAPNVTPNRTTSSSPMSTSAPSAVSPPVTAGMMALLTTERSRVVSTVVLAYIS